jgi:hypothetical protein
MAFPGYAEDGGLIGYGPHLRSMFGQAGDPRGDDPGLALARADGVIQR